MPFRQDTKALILAVLEQGEAHGYEIARRIKTLSDKSITLSEGQIYPSLHDLEEQGYVQARWVPQEGKPDRRVYVLTEQGHKALSGEREKWKSFAKSISNVMGLPRQGESNA